MEKPELVNDEQIVTLDFTKLPDALAKSMDKVLEKRDENLTAKLMEALGKSDGKGQIIQKTPSNTKLVEAFNRAGAEISKGAGRLTDETHKIITEQWTVVIPDYTRYEIAAHLRDFVWVTDIVKGRVGETVNIPYVADAEFEILSSVGDAFAAAWTSLVSSVTTTLYEAGGWYDLPYYLLEKIDQNLLDEINKMLAIASVRAEDEEIMTLINAGTSTNFAGNVTRLTASAYFYATNVPSAIQILMTAGKSATTSECVLYMTPHAYGALLAELAASQVIAYAVPSIIVKGQIENYLGVSIVVGGYRPSQQRTNAATGTVDLCFLMRGKRAVALAPKRELLIETDKQIATRALRIAASHTFGVDILDFKEIVRIWTSRVA
jgi:HK97 family phage major capsid protein